MFYYNLLKNARIKSTSIGSILILLNIILFSLPHAGVTMHHMLFLMLPSFILLSFCSVYYLSGRFLKKYVLNNFARITHWENSNGI